jgi:hypothetical protein
MTTHIKKGGFSTVDLLVLTSLDNLILSFKCYLPFSKTCYLNEGTLIKGEAQ